jgi:hypothetical protein
MGNKVLDRVPLLAAIDQMPAACASAGVVLAILDESGSLAVGLPASAKIVGARCPNSRP